jgi:hypothetical protein
LKPGGETGYRYFEDYNSAQALMEIKNNDTALLTLNGKLMADKIASDLFVI